MQKYALQCLIICAILCICTNNSVSAQNKSKSIPNSESEQLHTKYDKIVRINIPIKTYGEIPENFKYALYNPDHLASKNTAIFNNLPLKILQAAYKNECTLAGEIEPHYNSELNTLHKDSIDNFIWKKLYLPFEKNAETVRKRTDSIHLDIGYNLHVSMHIRDSAGTIVYEPERLFISWNDHTKYRPNQYLCLANLNQPFFHTKKENGKTWYEEFKNMEYEYYPVSYFYKKGSKTCYFFAQDYETSIALKYTLLAGGLDQYSNLSSKSRRFGSLKNSEKQQLKSEKAWNTLNQ